MEEEIECLVSMKYHFFEELHLQQRNFDHDWQHNTIYPNSEVNLSPVSRAES